MTKQAEIDYFGRMDDNARSYAGGKPFASDRRGAYLLDMGQILDLIRQPPARLLDLGCGSGWTTAMFARSGYDAFDVAVLYDCLHHAEREQAVLQSVFAALAEGGEVILVEPGRGHHDSPGSQEAVQAHGVTEKDMHPALTTRLLRAAGFSEIRVFPRVQFQMVERCGTGGIVRALRPLFGPRLAGLAKTLKNSAFPGTNGVVLARKTTRGRESGSE